MRRLASIFVVGFCACTSDLTFVELPAPAGAQTVWFSSFVSGEAIDEIYDLARAPIYESKLDDKDGAILSYFAEPLDDFELEEGLVPSATEDSCYGRAPPATLAAFRLVDDQLEPIDGDPLDSRKFRYELPCPCLPLDISFIPLPDDRRIDHIVRLGHGRALINARGEFSSVSTLMLYDDGAQTLVESATVASIYAACSSGEAPAHLAGATGDFFVYDPDLGVRSGPNLPQPHRVEVLTCAPSGAPPETFALELSGRVHRFEGEAWSTSYDNEIMGQEGSNLAAMTWIAPGQLAFVAGNGIELVYLDGGQAKEISWGPDQTVGPRRGGVKQLLFTQQFGLLMLTRTSNLLVDAEVEGGWDQFSRPPAGAEQSASFKMMMEVEDRLLLLGERSGVWEYNPVLSDFCTNTPISDELQMRWLARIEDDLYLAGGQRVEVGGINQLVVIRVR